MRITDQRIFQDASTFTAKARQADEAAQAQVSTGLRVQHAGDDAAAAGLMVSHGLAEARLSAIASGATSASAELASADNALQGVNDALLNATQLATQMANDTVSPSQRSSAAAQVTQLSATIVGLLNTKDGSRYLFGGNQDSKPPFDSTGAYLGDTGVRQVEVAPGVMQPASVRADVALKGAGGGVDVLAALSKLQAALTSNDAAGISASLTALKAGTDQVSQARAAAGISIGTLTAGARIATTQRDAQTASITALGGADEVQAASSLALAQRALEASITASAQAFQMTLLNKIQ